MLTPKAIQQYLEQVVDGILQDARAKNQAIPLERSIVITEEGGQLHWANLKYVILGRGPGKFPPMDRMLDYVQRHPRMLASAKQVYANITERGLAYLIGRKIATQGTDIYQGKKPGIDLLGVMQTNMPELLSTIARNESVAFLTNLRNELNR